MVLDLLVEALEEIIDASVKENDGADDEPGVRLSTAILHPRNLALTQVANDGGNVTKGQRAPFAGRFDPVRHTMMRHMFVLLCGAYIDRRLSIVACGFHSPQPMLCAYVATVHDIGM